ncbi:MAG: hypothetical protein HOF74_10275 [Gammaproteobacteria bacterium]|jgi:protein-S-isoprenylcysteine O-methyltransferase Ste14|nr:hypothetical protein [Gammaproteobacteria bacterium]MBT3860206.1 hypothetical protein [Gammaproteobacteria bacterium]MBT3987498.1 hypothetical protein [Gammaproteobacteria bacterium]MBT4255344.1 hypothetical protein [Gammaproteobacteria bacterium]MBT4581764.1 hypothetical protein [Gammaproteobacteria bacterium]
MKILVLLYGLISYAIGMAGLTFFILYVGSWDFMPVHIESGSAGPLGTALLINTGLMLIWTLQHTVMARPGFKEVLTTIIPESIERSTYVMLSGILMIFMSLNWQTIDGSLWNVEGTMLGGILFVLYLLGWVVVVLSSFLISHFELFGLRQVWNHFRDQPDPDPSYTERFFYKFVRHPLQFGVLMGLWFTPNMSMTHFCLAAMMTVYIMIGLHYEEKDLEASLGDSYSDYKTRVRKLIPIPKK